MSRFLAFVLVICVLASAGCGTLVNHKVEKGDSLYSIGFYYGQDYRDVAQWNDIVPPYTVHVGQWLRVVPPEKHWRDANENHKTRGEIDSKPSLAYPQPKPKVRVAVKEDFTDRQRKISVWSWPATGTLLHPNKRFSERKNGIKIKGKRGQPVRATAAGKVVYSGDALIGYGKLLIIKHDKIYLSAYAHNDVMLVKDGDIVKQGQQIAKMGLTPDQRILLHFEIRKNGQPIDPLRLLTRKN